MSYEMIFDFLIYFLITALSLVWFYGAGWLLLKICKISFSSVQFSALIILLLGITMHVIVFSIYKTHFATFNVLLVILMLFIWWEYRKEKSISSAPVSFKLNFKKIIELQVIVILFFILKIASTIQPDIYPYFHASRDDIFYSQIASFISQNGVETFYIDWEKISDTLGVIPYHYFELWLNSLLTEVTGLLSINTYFFVTSSIIMLLLYQAILMIVEEVTSQKIGLKHKIIAVSVIFLGDLFFGMIPSEILPNLTGGLALYDNLKIVIIFIVLALSWRAWKYGHNTISLLMLLVVPLLNYGLMPVIMVSVPVFFIIHRWFLKKPELIPYRKILIYYSVYIVMLLTIQKIFKNPFAGVTILGVKDLIAYFDDFSKIKTLVHFALNYFLMTILLLLPYFFILIPLKKYKLINLKSSFVVLSLLLLLASIGLSSVLYFILDTSQIFTIVLNVLSHLLLYIIIPLLLFKVPGNFFYKALVGVFLLSGICLVAYDFTNKESRMSRYSIDFLNSVQSVSDKINGQGIRYLTPDYYSSAYVINPNCNFEGYYLSFLKNNVVIHTLTVDQIPDKKELHDFFNYNKKIILKSSFYLNFVQQMKLEHTNTDSVHLAFVKNNNIDFVVATKNAIVPPAIANLVYDEITDSLSGEKIMFIDRGRLLKQP